MIIDSGRYSYSLLLHWLCFSCSRCEWAAGCETDLRPVWRRPLEPTKRPQLRPRWQEGGQVGRCHGSQKTRRRQEWFTPGRSVRWYRFRIRHLTGGVRGAL